MKNVLIEEIDKIARTIKMLNGEGILIRGTGVEMPLNAMANLTEQTLKEIRILNIKMNELEDQFGFLGIYGSGKEILLTTEEFLKMFNSYEIQKTQYPLPYTLVEKQGEYYFQAFLSEEEYENLNQTDRKEVCNG